ncbi:ABC transporter ATP-binding protein [Elioraea sp.]|uniref:ABC transporter ATP-binding protein n=1 Tax=Elioraea sp. TaxID=2185103 RepID=UPI0025C61221|nr:ABC transporter ATP-binding protein [Elioraea sp.]
MSGQGVAAFLDVAGVSKAFGAHAALDDCTLAVRQGEIVTLLGASGCGKTTLLRIIAGFVAPDSGTVRLGGQDALAMPVNRRPIGVVFQSYALFPHMTVARNVGYGLRVRGVPREEQRRRLAEALELVSLTAFADRYPAQLSGGQQQRVALARALVLAPQLLLLDEPFSALDAKLRAAMQSEVRRLIKSVGITAVFVTHDQDEAMGISDAIAVMRGGRIEQAGPPAEVYDRPASAFVADFVGAANHWPDEARGGRVTLPAGLSVPSRVIGRVSVMVRPHNLEPCPVGAEGAAWRGRVAFVRPSGPFLEIEVLVEGAPLPFRVTVPRAGAVPAPGEAVALRVRDLSACFVFPRLDQAAA